MNIFFLSRDPTEAAQLQHNKHVVKMTLESAQLLCTAHHVMGSDKDKFYKPTHVNHPCSVWVRSNALHYEWLYKHFKALAEEYGARYFRKHKSWRVLGEPLKALPQNIPRLAWTDPPQCMPAEFRCVDTVRAYQQYYADKIKNWT